MKKHLGRKIALALFLVLFVGGLIWFCGGETYTTYERVGHEHTSLYQTDFYESAPLVITGRYLGDERVFGQEGTGTPQTIGTVQVETVYKGEAKSGDTIPIRFTGGTISLLEGFSKQQKESAQSLKEAVKSMILWVVCARLGNKVTVESNALVDARPQQEYLLFLKYDEEAGVYQVRSEGYGMRPLNEAGKVYDPYSQSYQALPAFLKAKD